MKEYIEREAAIDTFVQEYPLLQRDRLKQAIASVSAADVRENVQGEWLINSDGYYPYCSHCKREPQGRVMTDFCPNCGADMKVREN